MGGVRLGLLVQGRLDGRPGRRGGGGTRLDLLEAFLEHAELLVRQRDRGFTLIELLVVIAIIAILAGLAAGVYGRAQASRKIGLYIAGDGFLRASVERWALLLGRACPVLARMSVPLFRSLWESPTFAVVG